MELFAYLASGLIGVSLGLIGGGGSILTVPVMAYLFGINPLLATSYSLFIVGTTSLVGAYQNFRNKLVDIRTALLFGLSSIITVFLIRKFLIPLIPEHLFSLGGHPVTSNMLTMLLFALLMLSASYSMIRDRKTVDKANNAPSRNNLKLVIYGVGIGCATGFLGAGGGFLLIPTLVVLLGMPMNKAVGTSLMIIALNALIGFIGDLGHFLIDWRFLLQVTGIAVAGVYMGIYFSKKIDTKYLKKGFGWFVLLMGGYILLRELIWKAK